MVRAYWLLGQAIVEHEQQGADRADYGRRTTASLSLRLTKEFGRGFGENGLWYMRQFYLTFPGKLHALRGELSWTHYRLLLKVEKPEARVFYERARPPRPPGSGALAAPVLASYAQECGLAQTAL